MSEIRFYLDENVPNAVADGLRNQGIDAITTPEAGNSGLDDTDQVAFALREHRDIVTQDNDFLVFASQGHEHAGIAYYKAQTRTKKQLIHKLRDLHSQVTAEQMRDHVEFL